MSSPYASLLRFETCISVFYRRLIYGVVILSFIAIAIIDSHLWWLQILLLFGLLFTVRLAWKQNCAWQCQARSDGRWLIQNHQTNSEAWLEPDTVVTPWFAALRFVRPDKFRQTIWLFSDNIDTEEFRRLRVKLKVEGIRRGDRDTLLP